MQGQEFKIGDWVLFAYNNRFSGYVGFINKFDSNDNEYRVFITRDPDGKPVKGGIWADSSNLIYYNNASLDEDDLWSLIDVAIDLKDRDWFLELTAKLPISNF